MIRLTNIFSKQHPIVIHVPGDWRVDEFKGILEKARLTRYSLAQDWEPCPELSIITWNNGSSKCKKILGSFEESCRWWGVEPIVVGQDVEVWTVQRTGLTLEALDQVDTEFVFASDSGDSLLLGPPEELLRRYTSHFTADLVYLAGGPVTWPPLDEFRQFEDSMPWAEVCGGQKGLCSGTFIGKTKYCRKFLERVKEEGPVDGYSFSEMAKIKRVWPQYYPNVTIDYLSIMFQFPNSLLEIEF